jgi:hypothetical protein
VETDLERQGENMEDEITFLQYRDRWRRIVYSQQYGRSLAEPEFSWRDPLYGERTML